jgi:hypothetical protein
MARFKVLLQRNGFDDKDTASGLLGVLKELLSTDRSATGDLHSYDLEAQLLEGEFYVGQKFTGFESYHPVECTITSIAELVDGRWSLRCESDCRLHKGFFDSAIVDTSGSTRGVHFRYDHDDVRRPSETK